MATQTPGDIRRAVKLFNRWQFEEAQTAFQKAAESYQGRERAVVDGLAAVSSGFHRIWHKGGESNAMVTWLERGVHHLDPFEPGMLGVDLPSLREPLLQCIDEARRWRRGDEEIFNRDFIPRLELIGGDD